MLATLIGKLFTKPLPEGVNQHMRKVLGTPKREQSEKAVADAIAPVCNMRSDRIAQSFRVRSTRKRS